MRGVPDSILMKRQLLLVLTALLSSLALRAQPSTSSIPAGQSSASLPQSAQPTTPARLEDDPAFQKLSPQMQEHVRKFDQMLREGLPTRRSSRQGNGADSKADNAPVPNAQTAKPAAPSPCAVAPKKPGLFDKLKQHAKQALEKQAAKADAQISKASKGNVDAGVKDATTTAVTQAEQQNPCPPAKTQPAKQ